MAKIQVDPGFDGVRWLDDREQRAWRSLQRMQALLTAALARELVSDSELSYQDYTVLVALTDAPCGALRLFELAVEVGWERSRASHHIARMAGRGLVRKERCDSDRRGAVVVVTDAGRRAIEGAAPGHAEAVRRYFVDMLDPDELDAVGAAARRVLDVLQHLSGCETSSGDIAHTSGVTPSHPDSD